MEKEETSETTKELKEEIKEEIREEKIILRELKKELKGKNVRESKKELKGKNVRESKKEKKELEKVQTRISIMGIPVIRLMAYIVIYSIIGFFIETLFGIITEGVVESRKSFLYGPFCAIYGVGAVTLIVGLQKFNKNNYTLFIGGFLLGSIVEYLISWVGEMIFDVKWWDYSNIPFNINGRVCIWFSLFWGVLAIYLMTHIHPNVDKILDKIAPKLLKTTVIILVIFMFLDWIISSFALQMFFTRLVHDGKVEIKETTSYTHTFKKLYENQVIKKIVDTLFSDEIMVKSFPNLKITTKDGQVVLVRDILTDIQPYYFKLFIPPSKKVIPK